MILVDAIIGYAIAIGVLIYMISNKSISLPDAAGKFDEDKYETVAIVCVIFGFVIGFIVIIFLITLNLLSFDLNQQDYGLLLSTSATIIGTILAVSFSILILGLQHALSRYAPSILRYFMLERVTLTCFVILSFSTVICIFGLIFPWKAFMVPLTLFLLPYCFIVLGYYYYSKSKTSTTLAIFDKLRIDGQKFIKNKLENVLIERIRNSSRKSRSAQANQIHRGTLRLMVATLLNDTDILRPLHQTLEEMIGLIHNCLNSDDYQSVKYGLDTICDLIRYYIHKRKENPPDTLIQSLYSQIEAITTIAIEKNNSYVLKNIVRMYEEIGVLGTRNAN